MEQERIEGVQPEDEPWGRLERPETRRGRRVVSQALRFVNDRHSVCFLHEPLLKRNRVERQDGYIPKVKKDWIYNKNLELTHNKKKKKLQDWNDQRDRLNDWKLPKSPKYRVGIGWDAFRRDSLCSTINTVAGVLFQGTKPKSAIQTRNTEIRPRMRGVV